MTIKKWVYLFWTTLAIGTATGLAAGALLLAFYNDISFGVGTIAGYDWVTLVSVLLIGATVSVLSQMGFFAYLMVRYVAVGIFRRRSVWELIQLFLIAVVFFDMIYLPYVSFAAADESVWSYVWLPVLLLCLALLVSWWKMKQTNRHAFIPTLFFMYVVTCVEAVPALRENIMAFNLLLLTLLFVSNAWQIMLLHKLVPSSGTAAAANSQAAQKKTPARGRGR